MSLEQDFLRQIADSVFDSEKDEEKRAFFLRRFDPENRKKIHDRIVDMVKEDLGGYAESKKGETLRLAIALLDRKYQKEMNADGFVLPEGQKGKKDIWKIVYNWLWDYKFPRCQVDKYWQLLQQKVKDFNFEWIRFVPPMEILETDRMMKASSSKPIKSKTPQKITANQKLLMSVDLPSQNSYLLLLNRGFNSRLFVCPSAVATDNHIVKTPIFLPLEGSKLDRIEFSDPGKEEYLAIVLDRPLEVEWLQLNEDDPFPSCEPDRMMELWQQLEGRNDWRVYYEAFEVVEE